MANLSLDPDQTAGSTMFIQVCFPGYLGLIFCGKMLVFRVEQKNGGVRSSDIGNCDIIMSLVQPYNIMFNCYNKCPKVSNTLLHTFVAQILLSFFFAFVS